MHSWIERLRSFGETACGHLLSDATMRGFITSIETTGDVRARAVVTADEAPRWNGPPPEEQLARLRAAIQRGIDSGVQELTMDDIWARIRARPPVASL